MMIYELDNIEKEVLLGKALEGVDLNETRQRSTGIDFTSELQKHGCRIVPDGSGVIVLSGKDRDSRAKRYQSAEIAYNTLILFPQMEAKQKG